MADVSATALRAKIKMILKGADLNTLSAKKVRVQLQTEIGQDLSERKKEIDKMTMELIMQAGDESNEEEDQKDEDLSNIKNGKSSEESEIEEEKPPPKKKAKVKNKTAKPASKKTAAPISAKLVEDSDEDDAKMNDEELAQRLQEEEEQGGRRTRHRSVKKTPVKRKPPKERKKREGTSAYSRPCLLSPELAKLMGTNKMARNEVVKRIWEIKKERNLHDQKDKRYMICDDELLAVFGRKRVQTFGMMKYLKKHIKDEHDVAPTSKDDIVDDDDDDLED